MYFHYDQNYVEEAGTGWRNKKKHKGFADEKN